MGLTIRKAAVQNCSTRVCKVP